MNLRSLRRVVPLLLAMLSVLAVGAVSADAATTTAPSAAPVKAPAAAARATFGIAPVVLGKSNARGFFSYQMGVGGSYSDAVEVVNYATAKTNLSVFAADLTNGDGGSLAVGLANARTTDAGGWVSLPHKTQVVTLPAATKKGPGKVVLPFTVRVPDDAIPGDHAAAIVATLSTIGKNSKGVDTRLDQRVATRIYLRVAGPLHPSMVVENLHVKYHGTTNPIGRGRATVTYTVHNLGNVRLAATQLVSVSGSFGTKVHPIAAPPIQLLFPRSSQQVTVEVSGVLPTVWQRAKVTVTPELFADEKPMPVPTDTEVVKFYAVPWTLFGLILLVILLLIGGLLWRRHRRRRPSPPSGSRHGAGNRPKNPTDPVKTPELTR